MSDTTPKSPERSEFDLDLRGLVYRSSTWLVAGTMGQQVVRLVSNLILTRLLFAEDFGLVALVFAWVQGLILCSDLGVSRSVIQHPEGDTDEFLGTAFTLQIVRAVGLCAASVLVAWPMSVFYEMPDLKLMLPVASLAVLIGALHSPRAVLLVRNLQVRTNEGLSIASALAGLLFTVNLAMLWGSAWALIVGGLSRDLLRLILTYIVCPPRGIRPRWNRQALKAILNFGRWIMVSSVFAFLALQADRLIAGKFVPAQVLGHLSIALLFVGLVRSMISRVGKNLLMPIFAKTEGTMPERLADRFRKARLLLVCIFVPVLCGMALLGPELISLLYEDRWTSVGFYLQCAVVGYIPSYILSGTGVALLGIGDSKGNFMVTAVEVISQVVLMLVGVLTWGLPGMLVARGISTFISYPVLASRLKQRGIWLPWLDLVALLASFLILSIGFYVKSSLLT